MKKGCCDSPSHILRIPAYLSLRSGLLFGFARFVMAAYLKSREKVRI